MTQISFKKLLAKKEVAELLNQAIKTSSATVGIQDAQGNLLWGKIPEHPSGKYPIAVGDRLLGWVVSQGDALSIPSVLNYLAKEEIEKRQMASELLQKYKEINLFYRLSEKITASLELSVVMESVIGETKRLIETTSGSIMLLNEEKKALEIISAFGTTTEQNSQVYINLDEGIAGSVFKTGKGELINNVSSDPRFVAGQNPVSSLMCAPLKTRDRVMGVLTISNQEPIDYKAEDLQLLTILASQAAHAIENVILHKSELKAAVARNEIEKGQQMQKDFLPDRLPQISGWDLAALFAPARQVAGDFYDAFLLDNMQVGLVIADVCDKGVGSALFMALFRSLIRVFSGQTHLTGLAILAEDQNAAASSSPARQALTNSAHINALIAVALTNNYVAQNHSNLNMFATLFFGVLDPVTGLLTYVNGGHEPLVILSPEGVKERLKPTGPAVGIFPNMKFKINQTYIEPGELLFGYTDGVTDARCPTGEFFTQKRLLSLLNQPPDSANVLLEQIHARLTAHIADADQFDDITMLAVRREVSNT
jgi:sigma-B regulation protein RsbU (phosphoserine phosphatase)